MYPSLVVIDNFFEDPDGVVDFANSTQFYPSNGRYPGQRSDNLDKINTDLEIYIGKKIIKIFYDISRAFSWHMSMGFQKIKPMHENQYHPKNLGWVHTDSEVSYGGVIYLNKNPEPDTGTSVFLQKHGWSYRDQWVDDVMTRFYRGEDMSDDEYESGFYANNNQYLESIRIDNVYNRLVFFSCDTYHAAQTYGKNQERLTIDFFGTVTINNQQPPMYR